MDAQEQIAEKLLKRMGFESVIYEPDGNVPPDFLADGRVAVEVRRLNQNHDSGDGIRGLEETSIPLWKQVEKLAHSMGPPGTTSWFLWVRFSRPVKLWKEIKPGLKAALSAFKTQPTQASGRIFTDGTFEVDAIKASQPLETFFRMGGRTDLESGGFIVAEMLKNLQHCIAKKSQKIANVKAKYKEWWLVFVDFIGQGLDDYDRQQLLAHAKRPADWDKIVVVAPSEPIRWFEF